MNHGSTGSLQPHRPRALLAAVALAQALIGIDYNIVFVALPRIATLGFDDAGLPWVVGAYAIAFGGLLMLSGRLVDQHGRRRMFLAGMGLFVAGSLIGGAATSPAMLVAGRAVQGAGGAALSPALLAIIAASFAQGSSRNRALATWAAAGSTGMVVGSVLGGILTESFGWRAVFYVNVPIAALVVVLGCASLPVDRPSPSHSRLDLAGGVLVTAAASLAVTGLTLATERGWRSGAAVTSLLLAALSTVLLVMVERRAGAPLFGRHHLRNRYLLVGTASTFLFMAGFGALGYFLTIYLQEFRGLAAISTGLVFVVPCVGVLVGAQVGGRLATGGQRRTLVVGNTLGGVFVLALSATLDDDGWLLLLAVLLLLSVGQGIVFTTMFSVATTGVPDHEQGSVGGIATTGQQIGGAVGLAAVVSLTAGSADPTRDATIAIAAIIALGAATALLVPHSADHRRA